MLDPIWRMKDAIPGVQIVEYIFRFVLNPIVPIINPILIISSPITAHHNLVRAKQTVIQGLSRLGLPRLSILESKIVPMNLNSLNV